MNQPGSCWIRRLSPVLALALMTSLAAARTSDTTSPRATEAAITRVTASLLGSSQLAHHPLDAQLAGKLLDRYMDALDGRHSLFLGSDPMSWRRYARPWRKRRKSKVIRKRRTSSSRASSSAFASRSYSTPISCAPSYSVFTDNDRVQVDRTHEEHPRDLSAAHALWRQQLRAEVLEKKLAAKPPKDLAAT